MAMTKRLKAASIFDDYAHLPSQHISKKQIAPFDMKASSAMPKIILSIPHGGFHYVQEIVPETYPYLPAMRSLEDSGTSLLKDMIKLDEASILAAPLSRALIDLNRPAYALDPQLYHQHMPPPDPKDRFTRYIHAGYGVAPRLSAQKTALYGQKLNLATTNHLIEDFHKPYHDKLASLLQKSAAYHGEVILMDIHSMPSHYGSKICPDFVFGDHFGQSLPSSLKEIISERMKMTGYSYGWNHPYAGGYITTHYGKLHGPIYAVQIEINRALYTKADNQISCHALTMIADIICLLGEALKTQIGAKLAAE